MSGNRTYRIILSGGGTGGHIFPAISVADKAMKLYPGSEILFVGAKGKMEMEKVPQAGYRIEGLPVAGLQRKFTLKNLSFPFRLLTSLSKAKSIIRDFKPDLVAGFGGFASGPLLWIATGKNIPSVIQEQNSFAGITNKILSKRVRRICVAYDGMERYFPADKISVTGNPVREDLFDLDNKKNDGYRHFRFSQNKKTILVIGGSLGARTINESILSGIEKFISEDIQLIWQVGKLYMAEYQNKLKGYNLTQIRLMDFIREMDLAYAVADLVIARAGAITVTELSVAGKPAILVPSPNVAEDHQTKNARSLTEKSAAILIPDREAGSTLAKRALELIHDESKRKDLSENISRLAHKDAAGEILNIMTGLLN